MSTHLAPYVLKRQIKYLILIPILLFCCVVSGQQKLLKFENYTKDEGLLHSYILSIFQDSDGYIWVGSYGGLNRFDGSNFTGYSNRTEIKTPTNVIHDIHESPKTNGKMLWFGTDKGLVNLHKPTMTFTHYPGENEGVLALAEDATGNLWLGTTHKGLLKFNPKNKKFGNTELSFTEERAWGDKITTLYTDNSGTLWIGGNNTGLIKYNTSTNTYERFVITTDDAEYGGNTVNCIYEHHKNFLIGTAGGGLYFFNTQTKKFTKIETSLEEKAPIFPNITGIAPDHEGDLWLTTLGGGLYELKLAQTNNEFIKVSDLHQYTKSNCGALSIANNILDILYKDQTGNFWIGTLGGGLTKLDFYNHKFNHYQIQNEENGNLDGTSVLCTGQDKNGNIWYGTQSEGIYTYTQANKQLSHIRLPTANRNNAVVRQIYSDNNNNMWVGTDGGLFLMSADGKQKKFFNLTKQGLSGGSIHAIWVDRSNQLWLGIYEHGVYQIPLPKDPFTLGETLDLSKRYQDTYSKGNLSSNLVWSIYEDNDGQIWVGTSSGLDRFEKRRNSFQCVLKANVNSLHESTKVSSNSLWVGSYGDGVFLMDKSTYKTINFSTENGLSNNNINGILEDENGKIWLGTEKGICSIDPSGFYNIDVSTLSADQLSSKRVHAYYFQDGLQGHEFHLNANENLNDGRLLFGGPKGFNIFNPQNIIENTYVFQTKITDFKIHNKSIKSDSLYSTTPEYMDSITLDYINNYITIEFSQVCLSNHEHASNLYMLEGYDTDWIRTNDIQGKATYTGLPEGTYLLKIKSINPDGFESEEITKLFIKILPPWYRTIWFLSLAGISLIILTFLTYKTITKRNRFRHESDLKLQQEKFEKEKLQTDIEYKNRELSSSAMYLLNRNEKLIEVRELVESSVKKTEGKTTTELNKIIKKIEDILKDKDNWESFEKNFNQIDTDFTKRLMDTFPALSNNDVKICTYMRMNLSSKEIAGLLNIAPKSLETSRLRIRKKMEIESSLYLSDFILKF